MKRPLFRLPQAGGVRYDSGMESFVRDIQHIEPDERRLYESLLGSSLQENQRVIVRVVDLGKEPEEPVRRAALGRAAELARQGRQHAADSGASQADVDSAVHDALADFRRRGT